MLLLEPTRFSLPPQVPRPLLPEPVQLALPLASASLPLLALPAF